MLTVKCKKVHLRRGGRCINLIYNFIKQNQVEAWFCYFVTGLGLEPRLPGPKPGVLPLDDPVKYKFKNLYFFLRAMREILPHKMKY